MPCLAAPNTRRPGAPGGPRPRTGGGRTEPHRSAGRTPRATPSEAGNPHPHRARRAERGEPADEGAAHGAEHHCAASQRRHGAALASARAAPGRATERKAPEQRPRPQAGPERRGRTERGGRRRFSATGGGVGAKRAGGERPKPPKGAAAAARAAPSRQRRAGPSPRHTQRVTNA